MFSYICGADLCVIHNAWYCSKHILKATPTFFYIKKLGNVLYENEKETTIKNAIYSLRSVISLLY